MTGKGKDSVEHWDKYERVILKSKASSSLIQRMKKMGQLF